MALAIAPAHILGPGAGLIHVLSHVLASFVPAHLISIPTILKSQNYINKTPCFQLLFVSGSMVYSSFCLQLTEVALYFQQPCSIKKLTMPIFPPIAERVYIPLFSPYFFFIGIVIKKAVIFFTREGIVVGLF